MTTPLQKAAQGAAEEWAANYSGLASGILEKIILKHLAPVQTELDRIKPYETAIIEACMVRECSGVNEPAKAIENIVAHETKLWRDELDEARKLIIESRGSTCECRLLAEEFKPCFGCRKQSWLARNPVKKG